MKKYLILIFIGIISIVLFFIFMWKKNNEILQWWEDLNNTAINNDYQWGLEPPKDLWKYKKIESDYQWWLLPPKNLWKFSSTGEVYQWWLMPPANLRK